MTISESVTSNNNSRDSRPESALRTGLASLITIVALAWAMGLFQAFEIYLYPAQLVIAVLGFAIALAYIHLPARRLSRKRSSPWYDWILATIGLVTTGWMSARYPLLVDLTIDAPREIVLIGFTVILLTLEALRRATEYVGLAAKDVGIFLVSIAMTAYFLRPIGSVARMVACVSGLLLWIPVISFATAPIVVTGAAASGVLLLAFEIVQTNRSGTHSGGQDNA